MLSGIMSDPELMQARPWLEGDDQQTTTEKDMRQSDPSCTALASKATGLAASSGPPRSV